MGDRGTYKKDVLKARAMATTKGLGAYSTRLIGDYSYIGRRQLTC